MIDITGSLLLVWVLLLFTPRAHASDPYASRSEPRSERRDQGRPASRTHYCQLCERTPEDKVRRSSSARAAFRREHPCPATGLTTGACPGHVVDHIIGLNRGGADEPTNMQWQTIAAARAKDRRE